ncbi:hypothetical protein IV102_37090 [bacterium]|nr:hypothetical protein [bacterium]
MRYRWPIKRGVSLLEALVTAFLGLLLLGVVALTVKEYRQVLSKSQVLDQQIELTLALRRLCQEVQASTAVLVPTASSLQLTRLDPGNPNRFPLQLNPPQPVPASWTPQTPSWLVTVDYAVVTGALTRRCTFFDGTFNQVVMHGPVEGLQVSRAGELLTMVARLPGGPSLTAQVFVP